LSVFAGSLALAHIDVHCDLRRDRARSDPTVRHDARRDLQV